MVNDCCARFLGRGLLAARVTVTLFLASLLLMPLTTIAEPGSPARVVNSSFDESAAVAGVPGCPVRFELDVSHAELLSNAYADGELTKSDIARFIEHPRTADVIRKTRSFGLDVDRAMLAGQLAMLGAGKPIDDISFGLGRYAERSKATAALLASLEDALPSLMESICGRLAPYVPADRIFKQSVVVVSAVNSTGFTFEDPSQIFLVAEAFNGDVGGFADIVVHESYHAIQSALTTGNPGYGDMDGRDHGFATAMRLLAGTILEGTATHVADPIEAGKQGAMRAFQFRLARRYRRDMPGLFVLFDTTLYRAFRDSEVNYDELVGIGLQGNEGFYHLGAYMARVIAETDGPQAIPAYFLTSPVAFFGRYLAIVDADPAGHPQFSSSTKRILQALSQGS